MNQLTRDLLGFTITNPEIREYNYDRDIVFIVGDDKLNFNNRLSGVASLAYSKYGMRTLVKLYSALELVEDKTAEKYKTIPNELIKCEFKRLLMLTRNKSPERLLLELNNE